MLKNNIITTYYKVYEQNQKLIEIISLCFPDKNNSESQMDNKKIIYKLESLKKNIKFNN